MAATASHAPDVDMQVGQSISDRVVASPGLLRLLAASISSTSQQNVNYTHIFISP